MQPSYIDQVNGKRQAHQAQSQHDSELASMLGELKKMQMAAMMGQSKPSVVLTDQTDLGDKISELTDRLCASVEALDSGAMDKQQIAVLDELKQGLDGLQTALDSQERNENKRNQAIISSIKALKLDTVVNVPDVKPVDLSPLLKPLQAIETAVSKEEPNSMPDWRDLSRYRAQDLKESGDIQYVGFVNPEGNWYIIENDTQKNTMRYAFGTGKYVSSFRAASTYKYQTLDKAAR